MPQADSVAKASVSQAVALLNISDNGDASARPEGGYQPPLVKVAVIGGGLAGLSAAIEVLKRGGSVVIIDKTDELGGNSSKASSGINACNSTAQLAQGIEDYPEAFKADTIKSGKGLSSEVLVNELIQHSADAVAFLQGFGVDLSNISQCGGHSHPRTHRARSDGLAMNIGWRIMKILARYVEQQPAESVQILLNATATSLILNKEKQVVGCNAEVARKSTLGEDIKEEMQIFADAVVLATGGFAADEDGLLKKYTPQIRNLATTNGSFATGDGVKMAEAIGAGLVDMDQVQLHPTGFVDPADPINPTKFLAPEALRGCGGILLNQKGVRFVNELTTRDAATKSIMENCEPIPVELVRNAGGSINGVVVSEDYNDEEALKSLPISAYMVLTEDGVFQFDRAIADFYIGKGLIRRFENAAAFAKAFALPVDAVTETLENYGRAKEDPYGKKTFPTLFSSTEPIYVLIITPSLHYTMGGLKFDANGQILKDNGDKIPGLFGAGEVTGGLHGGNRLGGNSLLECVVYGRIAGVNAWKSKKFTHGLIRRQHSYRDRKGVEHPSGLLPTEFKSLPLIERYVPNKSCAVLRFALPSKNHTLGLLCGQYLAVRYRAQREDEEDVVQYYSPMTPADEYGSVELVIKHTMIAPGSMPDKMMKMALGETLDFAGPLGGFMYEPNMYSKLGMIAGGTGISPMMQIIRAVTRHPADSTHLSLLYGNAEEDDILCKEELMFIATTRENVDVHMYLERPPWRWTMGRGFITEQAIREKMPPPHSNSRIIMCGPPIMMKVMKRTLKKIGYPDYQLYVFNDPESDPAVARG